MPQVPIIMPQLGESIAEATIVSINVKQAEKTKSNGARAKVPTDGLPVPAAAKGAGFLSPRVRARMTELQLTNADLAGIAGTGSGNRVTIKDLENYLRQMESQTTSDASAIRAGVADAMRRSWSRPLATIGSSVNLDPVLTDRK